ncbi:MAG: cupin domain-containing protein [Bryobacterales bacterium]|nr:cupin domain-containing protein [Bryobacteraceae bacterium]MDW8129315.1 cupin domain-containing protein [Bryobacterales bacterium]
MKILTIAFLLGWLWAAVSGAWWQAQGRDDQGILVSRPSERSARPAPADYFTGAATIEMLSEARAPGRTSVARVTFQPGARTAWHRHPLGQVLIVTEGAGWVQEWGGPIVEIRPGDVVRIGPGVKHWHGATPTTPLTHIAIQEQLEGRAAEWMEPVSEDEYRKHAAKGGNPAAPGPRSPSPQR